MHHCTCVTHVPWCMSGSLARGGGENVPGILGACATHNFTYLARGPCQSRCNGGSEHQSNQPIVLDSLWCRRLILFQPILVGKTPFEFKSVSLPMKCINMSIVYWFYNFLVQIFIHENASENIVCETVAILSGGNKHSIKLTFVLRCSTITNVEGLSATHHDQITAGIIKCFVVFMTRPKRSIAYMDPFHLSYWY